LVCVKFCRPKLRGVDLNAVKHVVETSEKQRFTLLFVPEEEEGRQGVSIQIPAGPETEQIPTPINVDVAEGSTRGDKGKLKESVDDITSGPGVWWIRANQGHTIKVTPPIQFLQIHISRQLSDFEGGGS
jgi:RNA:NAD 2'-phosphotransferase (TPT1/KptA family)